MAVEWGSSGSQVAVNCWWGLSGCGGGGDSCGNGSGGGDGDRGSGNGGGTGTGEGGGMCCFVALSTM